MIPLDEIVAQAELDYLHMTCDNEVLPHLLHPQTMSKGSFW